MASGTKYSSEFSQGAKSDFTEGSSAAFGNISERDTELPEGLREEFEVKNSTTSSQVHNSLQDLQDELTSAANDDLGKASTAEREHGNSGAHTRLRSLENELMQLDNQAEDSTSKLHLYRRVLARGFGGSCSIDINHPISHGFFAGIILINAVFIGVETDGRGRDVEVWSKEWAPWFIAETSFLLIFIIELALRFCQLSCKEARGDFWNMFDLFLVVLGAVDSWVLQFTLQDTGGSLVRLVRLVRLLRVLRIIRLFRFFKELTLLAQGILGALQAMSWAALLIIVILYVSAVLMTNTLGRISDSEIRQWFGSLGSSFFTLFQLMTLEDWPEVVRSSMHHESFVWLFFVPFMMFTNFAMLNVITAVVVEKVFTIARAEATEEAKKAEKKRAGQLRKIKQLFEEIDKDGNDELELEEFREALKIPSVMQQFMELGIARYEADDLFACLDVDGNEQISVAEFVEGVLRVHGPAQSKHLLQVQYDILRSKTALQADLNELGWYVKWVIRHLSYRYDWHRGHDEQATKSRHSAPKRSESAATKSGGILATYAKELASAHHIDLEEPAQASTPPETPTSPKVQEEKATVEVSPQQISASHAEIKNLPNDVQQEQPPNTSLDVTTVEMPQVQLQPLAKTHAVGTPPLATATPPQVSAVARQRDAAEPEPRSQEDRPHQQSDDNSLEQPALATQRLLNEASVRLLRHSVDTAEDRLGDNPAAQVNHVPQQLHESEADIAIGMLRSIRAEQATLRGAVEQLLKEVRDIREQFVEISGNMNQPLEVE